MVEQIKFKKIDLPNFKRQALIFGLRLDQEDSVVKVGEWYYDEYDSVAELDLGKGNTWYLVKSKGKFFVHANLSYPLEGYLLF